MKHHEIDSKLTDLNGRVNRMEALTGMTSWRAESMHDRVVAEREFMRRAALKTDVEYLARRLDETQALVDDLTEVIEYLTGDPS